MMGAIVKRERKAGRVPASHGGVVGQVWRDGGRQANLARLLRAVHVSPIDEGVGRRAGPLLARAGTSDVIDAAVALLARDGDEIYSTDPRDIEDLCRAVNVSVDIIRV